LKRIAVSQRKKQILKKKIRENSGEKYLLFGELGRLTTHGGQKEKKEKKKEEGRVGESPTLIGQTDFLDLFFFAFLCSFPWLGAQD